MLRLCDFMSMLSPKQSESKKPTRGTSAQTNSGVKQALHHLVALQTDDSDPSCRAGTADGKGGPVGITVDGPETGRSRLGR